MNSYYFRAIGLMLFFFALTHPRLFSQSIGIGTNSPDNSAALDITNTRKGLLIPRMTSVGITAISKPAKGLMVYDSVLNQLMVNMGTAALPNWQNIAANNNWGLTGNANTDTAINFIGTLDSIPLYFRVNNQPAGRVDSAYNNSTNNSDGNTFLGYGAGKQTTTASFNSAFGYQAIDSNRIGNSNTVLGAKALNLNFYTTGDENTVVGYDAVNFPDQYYQPGYITAVGYQAGYFPYFSGTALGYQAKGIGYASVTVTGFGAKAQGIGYQSQYSDQELYIPAGSYGANNTGYGFQALYSNTSGNYSVAFGAGAMYSGYSSQNTAVGAYSLVATKAAQGNVALGYNAGRSFDNGYYNCFIGSETDANGPQYFNTIALGHGTIVTAPNMMRVGNGATTSVGGQVRWSVISDGRVKRNIRENVVGLDFINKLKPVTYTLDLDAIDRIIQPADPKLLKTFPEDYPSPIRPMSKAINSQMLQALEDKQKIVYSGFIAQDVELAAKSVDYDFSGVDSPRNDKDLYGLRYASFVVPLVKAVQELALRNDKLKMENSKLNQQKEQIMGELSELESKAP